MDRFLEMQSFVKVVDTGSFVAAAQVLNLSKAAVSRHVSALEARLGLRLMQRSTRRQSLTSEGELFLARCRELLSGLEDAEAEVTARGDIARGLLRINVPVSFGIRRLAPLWGLFRQQHPQVRLDITLSDRIVDLVEEGYDLAIRIGNLSSSSLIGRQLDTTRLMICAAPSYIAAQGQPDHPAALAEHAVIGYSYWSGGDEWQLQGPQGPVTVRTRPCIRSNNGETCLAAALAGEGIVMQPDFLVGEDLAAGRLVPLLPDYRIAELGIHAVYTSRRHAAPKLRALLAFLGEHLSAGAQPFR